MQYNFKIFILAEHFYFTYALNFSFLEHTSIRNTSEYGNSFDEHTFGLSDSIDGQLGTFSFVYTIISYLFSCLMATYVVRRFLFLFATRVNHFELQIRLTLYSSAQLT